MHVLNACAAATEPSADVCLCDVARCLVAYFACALLFACCEVRREACRFPADVFAVVFFSVDLN